MEIAIILIAISLSIDSFAVSVSNGLTITHKKLLNALKVALFFGFFQAFMPVIGWILGSNLRNHAESFDHWIAFGLLASIGAKMIYESIKNKRKNKIVSHIKIQTLVGLSIATSIDALAIGITFALVNISLIQAVIVIGLITFLLSFLGFFIGNRLGNLFEEKIEIIGGLILIGIGLKILLSHIF
ncbi:MAG: manganese efflux pump MntP family protein [Patescibacteria group bacterium]|nr:manganese efflux pump MntP family protein [Patescibacteria group bacterium]